MLHAYEKYLDSDSIDVHSSIEYFENYMASTQSSHIDVSINKW